MVQEGGITIPPEPSGEGTSQPKSPMDVSDDEQDEDELRELQKANSIQCIEGMRMLPKEASRFDIPLCRMVYMPLVRPILAHDIKRLEAEFIHRYWLGAKLASNHHLRSLCGRMFFICDGNHRFKAWTCYIDRLHRDDREWHYTVDNICLETRGKGGLLRNAMHDINK
jgi:hypothetical protein